MENKNKLYSAFSNALGVDAKKIHSDLKYQQIPEWDSISHMVLISEIEAEFNISIDTEDVIDLSSVGKAQEILGKYGFNF